jgi:predicted thioesterase
MSSTLPIPPGIRPGLEATVEKVVPHEWTIAHFRSHLPPVLSTPAMIAMMEVAAAKAIEPLLESGSISVGTRIEVDHLKAVPAGASVTAWARLEKIDGRFLAFEVEARSGDTLIGKGRVFRAIVQPGSFAPKGS